jgi:hypothetical protein
VLIKLLVLGKKKNGSFLWFTVTVITDDKYASLVDKLLILKKKTVNPGNNLLILREKPANLSDKLSILGEQIINPFENF